MHLEQSWGLGLGLGGGAGLGAEIQILGKVLSACCRRTSEFSADFNICRWLFFEEPSRKRYPMSAGKHIGRKLVAAGENK